MFALFVFLLRLCFASRNTQFDQVEIDLCICHDSNADAEAVQVCEGRHFMHRNCIRQYRESPNTSLPDSCPFCRQNMSNDILEEFPIPSNGDDLIVQMILNTLSNHIEDRDEATEAFDDVLEFLGACLTAISETSPLVHAEERPRAVQDAAPSFRD
jgi:hypothetical protein